MALDGPYTIEDLLAMTGATRKKRALETPVIISRTAGAAPVKQKSVRLLGIDPGTRRVGWGLIERHNSDATLHLVESGCIAPSPRLELKDRLRDIFAELEEIITRVKPDAAALEETFAGVNMKSAIAMGEGRGIALLCLARAGLQVVELAPRSIKHAVTGSGAAGKPRVAAMVVAQLGLKKTPKPEDVTDALAAAIALARRIN